MKRSMCLLLVLVMLLTAACTTQNPLENTVTVPTEETAAVPETTKDPLDDLPDHHFSKMEYVRPDSENVIAAQARCMDMIADATWEELDLALIDYLEAYKAFETMFALSRIHYNLDLSDTKWEEEYNYCSQELTRLQSDCDQLMYALADTGYVQQLEETYFGNDALLSYTGVNFLTEEIEALRQEETRLMDQYFALSVNLGPSGTADVYDEIEALLVELVKLRQKIAATAGYDSFPEYAYANLHGGRDYTPQEAQAYLEQVRTEVAPLFAKVGTYAPTPRQPKGGSAFNYVKDMAKNAGGTVQEAFAFMEEGALYDVGLGTTKMGAAYTTYLSSYNAPYVFVYPATAGGASIAFTHEFGHFCQIYASDGLQLNVDTLEVFSQALEYLSMSYGDGTQNQYQRYSLLQIYVTSAAQADFELRLYALPEQEVTAENINNLYVQVGKDWGIATAGGFNRMGLVGTLHYYVAPMYLLSYSVSNDVALQMYELELQEPGAGLNCFEKALTTRQTKIISFAEEMGLASPFSPNRVQQIRETWEKLLQK